MRKHAMSKVQIAAELAALLIDESHYCQSDAAFREAYFQRTGDRYASAPPHVAARDALALLRIGASVSRWAVKACNGIVRYQGNGISCGTWYESDEAAKDRADKRALAKAQAIADRYGATVVIGGDPRGYVLRLRLATKRSNGMADDGWGIA